MRISRLVLVLVLSSFATLAAQNTWNGNVSTDWHTAANWSTSSVPTSATDVLIPNTAASMPVISAGNAPTRALTVQSGATLTVRAASTTTARFLDVFGATLNQGTIIANSSTHAEGANQWVRFRGNVDNQGTIRAIGSTSGAYAYFELNWVNSGSTNNTTTNSGTIENVNARSYFVVYGAFTNQSSGTVTLVNAGSSLGTATVPASAMVFRRNFTNHGTFTRSGVGTTNFYGDIINNNDFTTSSGTIRTWGSLQNEGDFDNTGTRLDLQHTTDTRYPDASLHVTIGGAGTWTLDGSINVEVTKVASIGTPPYGSLTLTSDVDFGQRGGWIIRAGTLDLNGFKLTSSSIGPFSVTSSDITLRLSTANCELDVVTFNAPINQYQTAGLTDLTLDMTAGLIRVRGSATFGSPGFAMDGGRFWFSGGPSVTTSFIQFGEFTSTAYFHDVDIDLHANTTMLLWATGTGDRGMNVRGDLNISSGSRVTYFLEEVEIRVEGNLTNNGIIEPWDDTSLESKLTLRAQDNVTLSGSGTTEVYDLVVDASATLTLQKDIRIRRDLDAKGTLNAGTSTVHFVFEDQDSTIHGSNNLYGLSCVVGKQLNVEAGTTQTVSGPLTLNGDPSGDPVTLRSTSNGNTWTINATGTQDISHVDVQDSVALTAIDASDNGTDSGNNTNWLFQNMLGVSVVQAAALTVFSDDTGGGNGLQSGSFTLANGATSAATSVTSITIQAGGTGDPTTAFTEVALYVDSGSGSFDPGTDTPFGTAASAFSQAGTLTFNGNLNVTPGATLRLFVVTKLNGTPLASAGETFTFTVSALSVSTGAVTGLPSVAMNGLTMATPNFTFTDASPATQQTVYAGTGDHVIQSFEVNYPGGPDNELETLNLLFSGTGDPATDIAQVALYRDDSGSFDPQSSTLIDSHGTVPHGGNVVFTLSGAESEFSAGDTRTYFVVVGYALGAGHNITFTTRLTATGGVQHGANVDGVPSPGGSDTEGHLVLNHTLVASFNGPGSYNSVDNDSHGPHGDGELLLDFSLESAEAAWTIASLTFTAAGSGDHDNAFTELALYRDTGNGTWDGSTIDTLAAPVEAGFSGGQVTFNLSSTAFPASESRRYFLVGKLAGSALAGDTFNARLESIGTTPPTGGVIGGLPTTTSTALIIDTAVLTIGNVGQIAPYMHKAGDALSHVIARYSLSATNEDITVNSMQLALAGAGNWATSIAPTNGVEFWLDDGDGAFDPMLDTLIAQTGSVPVVGNFGGSLIVANNSTVHLWVRVNLTPQAGIGATQPLTYSLSIADEADVQVAGAQLVMFGANPPTSGTLSVVDFFVTSFTPGHDIPAGGEPITITGSGFMAPFRVFINGVECLGTPVISGNGTMVTGLIVPPGSGENVAIEVRSGTLAPQTLGQTFNYFAVFTGGGNGGGGGGGGCASGTGSLPYLPALLALLAVPVLLARRRSIRRRA